MTRVNVVPVEELSDLWLLAEYRELPRALKSNCSLENAPVYYKLGSGHVKWAKKHALYTQKRMQLLVQELVYRGFKPTFKSDFKKYIDEHMKNDYNVRKEDLMVNRTRLIERYNTNKNVHKWTRRDKPAYLQFWKDGRAV